MNDIPELMIWAAMIFSVILMVFSFFSVQRRITKPLSLLATVIQKWPRDSPFLQDQICKWRDESTHGPAEWLARIQSANIFILSICVLSQNAFN